MRDVAVTEGDKVEAELRLGVSVNTYAVNDLVTVVDAVDDATVDKLVTEYQDRYDVAAELRRGGERHESLRYAARVEAGMRQFLDDGGFGAFTTNFEDLGGLRQLPGLAVQRLMADGYGFGGEGDWKTSMLLRTVKAMGAGLPGRHLVHGGLHLPPGAGQPEVLGAHMLEVCPSITTATADGRGPPPGHRRPRGSRAHAVRRRPGRGHRRGRVGPRRPVPPDRQRHHPGRARRRLASLPVACAVWEPHPDLADLGGGLADGRRAAPHRAVDRGRDRGVRRPRRDPAARARAHQRRHHPRELRRELRWNQAYHRLAAGL